MKNIIKVSICLLVVTLGSLNAANQGASPVKPNKNQPLEAMSMATVPTTYGQDPNVY